MWNLTEKNNDNIINGIIVFANIHPWYTILITVIIVIMIIILAKGDFILNFFSKTQTVENWDAFMGSTIEKKDKNKSK